MTRRPLPIPSNAKRAPHAHRELPDRTERYTEPRPEGFRERVRKALRWHW